MSSSVGSTVDKVTMLSIFSLERRAVLTDRWTRGGAEGSRHISAREGGRDSADRLGNGLNSRNKKRPLVYKKSLVESD